MNEGTNTRSNSTFTMVHGADHIKLLIWIVPKKTSSDHCITQITFNSFNIQYSLINLQTGSRRMSRPESIAHLDSILEKISSAGFLEHTVHTVHT